MTTATEADVVDNLPEAQKPKRSKRDEKHLSLLRPIASPDQIAQAHQEVSALIVKSLKEGQDYGQIPGAGDKKVLLKAGAERLAIAFGCRVEYEIVEEEIDHDRRVAFTLAKWIDTDRRPSKEEAERIKAQGLGRWRKGFGGKWTWQEKTEERGESFGLYRYVIRCRLVRHDGLVVGDAIGACSSLETKYIRQPRDSENTIVKMAQKRALVAVTLNAFGLSDRFTQDLEEMADVIDVEVAEGKAAAAKALEPQRAPEAPRPVEPPRAWDAEIVDEEALVEALVHAPAGDDVNAFRAYFEQHRKALPRAEQAILRAWLYARRNAAKGAPEGEENDPAALARAKDLLRAHGLEAE